MMSQQALILTLLAGYFIIWLSLAYFSSKGADNGTFFLGNRKMAWPLVAIAMLGAPISGVTFVSVPGMVAAKGFSYLQMCLGFFVGYLVIAFVLVPIYYKLNIVSVYGYLKQRFGNSSYKTGAWLFLVSKIFGISVRFLIVCTMLQLLLFGPLGIPYIYSVMVSLALIWLTTYRGGVKSVIWTDVLKSFCLLLTIGFCLYFVIEGLGIKSGDVPAAISGHPTSKIFYFDDPLDGRYFWKQFVAGIFIVVAMTGLDQDMMQRTLACRSPREARKNLVTSSLLQIFAITLLLCLGVVMLMFMQSRGMALPEKSDNIFPTVAFHSEIPILVGALFILGIISSTFASVGSAITAMTTSMTVDILEADKKETPEGLGKKRKMVHGGISVIMALFVIFFYYLDQQDAISTVYTIVSYTDGPILGLFLFGLLTKRSVNEKMLPLICIMAPLLSWSLQWAARYFLVYETSFELLILNSGLTFLGMFLISAKKEESLEIEMEGNPQP